MAQNLAVKKQNFMTAVVTHYGLFYTERNFLRNLTEEWNNNTDISSITQADIDATSLNWLTPVILTNALTVFEPDFEKILAGTATTPATAYLATILKVLGI